MKLQSTFFIIFALITVMFIPMPINSYAKSNTTSSEEQHIKVNIDTATVEELEALPGIGPVKAYKIVKHRKENGPFKDIYHITDVTGVGKKTLEKNLKLITTGN